MGTVLDGLTPELKKWIEDQKVFFVATAPLTGDGHVNLSPKGGDAFRILDDDTVAYLDSTGSGNETSAHILENGRITFMWCAFDGPPRIFRLYGLGEVAVRGTERWDQLIDHFTPDAGSRQIIVLHIQRVQSSCGFSVPFYEYVGDRDTLSRWAEKKGEAEVRKYQRRKNMRSIDGLETPIAQFFESGTFEDVESDAADDA
ncbi:MAG: pyridoxamine 5'-phosphate oxidase family protein [Planctomycetota bacterium]